MKIKNILSIVAILFFININAYSQSVGDWFVIGEEGYTLYYYVTSVEPNEVEIYNDNFEGENLIIPNVVTYEGVDYNVTAIGEYGFESCTTLETVTIKSTKIITIPDNCFSSCSNLHSISLPNSITEIGPSAFANTKLANITLPNSLTTIGSSAFANTKLDQIVLPNSLTTIGSSAFFKCRNLVSIRCNSVTPPTLESSALGATTGQPTNQINANLKIYVPATSTGDYLNAEGWSSYKDKIVGAPTFVTDGYWNEASNWSPEGVPSNEENVYINAAATILSSDIITVNSFGICNNGSLTIEEGGQLIHQSGSGIVTVKKNIDAYVIGNDDYLESGWYTISSPFTNASISGSITSGNYELYRYDETEYEWENHKNTENDFNTLESGRGYIYASDIAKELIISGELNTEDKTYHLTAEGELLTGFHLVGNPFMHNITKGVNGNLYNADLATGYYTLTNNGGWVAKSDDEPIAPTQGLLQIFSAIL